MRGNYFAHTVNIFQFCQPFKTFRRIIPIHLMVYPLTKHALPVSLRERDDFVEFVRQICLLPFFICMCQPSILNILSCIC